MTNIPSFISGSKFSPLVLEGGATPSASGEGFVKALGGARLPMGELNASPADATVSAVRPANNLVANEVDLTLPNDLAAKLLTAAGHSRPDAMTIASAKQPLVTAQVQSAAVDPPVPNSFGLQAAAYPQIPTEAASLKLTSPSQTAEPRIETAFDIDGDPGQAIPGSTAEADRVALSRDPRPVHLTADAASIEPAPASPEGDFSETTGDLASLDGIDTPALRSAKENNAPMVASAEIDSAGDSDAPLSDEPEFAPEGHKHQGDDRQAVNAGRAAQIAAADVNSPNLSTRTEVEVDPEASNARAEPNPRTMPTAEKSTADALAARSISASRSDQVQPDFAQRVATSAGQSPQAPVAPDAQSSSAPALAATSGAAEPSRAAAPPALPATHEPQITAQPGQLGKDLAVKIAKHTIDGQDGLTIRLDPAELGRIHVRMHFDEQGSLRAHVTAESNVALDMLRRESFDLARALTEAGVRTDSQSFRFDSRGQENGQQGHRNNHPEGSPHQFSDADEALPDETEYRRVRSNGAVDVFA